MICSMWQRSFSCLPSEQNNSWKSLCDGNKKRLASSGTWGDQGGRKKWNDGSPLWQIAFNLKTIQERSWYLFQSRAWIPLGCFKCFKWNQSQSPKALRQRRGEFQTKCPKLLLPCLSHLSLSLRHPHNCLKSHNPLLLQLKHQSIWRFSWFNDSHFSFLALDVLVFSPSWYVRNIQTLTHVQDPMS